jgi:hypothetical protein
VAAIALASTGVIAVVSLLVGDASEADGRIIEATAALAGAGLLAVPGALLLERGRGDPRELMRVDPGMRLTPC